MSRYLAVLLWAVVIAAFFGIALLARRTVPAPAHRAAAATGNGQAGGTP